MKIYESDWCSWMNFDKIGLKWNDTGKYKLGRRYLSEGLPSAILTQAPFFLLITMMVVFFYDDDDSAGPLVGSQWWWWLLRWWWRRPLPRAILARAQLILFTLMMMINNDDRGAFFAWCAPILSWPRIMCSQVRMSGFLNRHKKCHK